MSRGLKKKRVEWERDREREVQEYWQVLTSAVSQALDCGGSLFFSVIANFFFPFVKKGKSFYLIVFKDQGERGACTLFRGKIPYIHTRIYSKNIY